MYITGGNHMDYRIQLPDGATDKERKAYVKKMAKDGIMDLMNKNPRFKASVLRLWSRNEVKLGKDGYRVD